MKRTISGMIAYSKMIGTAMPEKTKTYTPIAHTAVINRVRSEITNAGYIITGEEYRSTNDGLIAIGTLKMNYKADPDIELSANFLNSYNKQFAFRFSLGGLVKSSNNSIMLSNSKFGSYKRVHKGSANILAEGKISEFINDSELYWSTLVEHKDKLKDVLLTSTMQHDILGELFIKRKILNTMQLNTIRTEMDKPSFDYKTDNDSAWALYNHIALALKDSHPSDWMNDQVIVHELFSAMLGLDTEAEIEPVMEEVMDEIPF
jgi:hypothetical protein